MKNQFIQRKRIRKEHFDYSGKGDYFITVCAFENRHLFGRIMDGKMVTGTLGGIAETWWYKIPERFPGVSLGDFVVMPNHVHGIIILEGREASEGLGREASEGLPYGTAPFKGDGGGAKAAPSVPQIIHWYKTWTTNEYFRYMKANFPGQGYLKLWHRSYYDHIIRTHEDYQRISNYIRNNPANWEQDRFSWPENNPRSTP